MPVIRVVAIFTRKLPGDQTIVDGSFAPNPSHSKFAADGMEAAVRANQAGGKACLLSAYLWSRLCDDAAS